DVQLGAALLMQFRNTDGQVVRVLADAGVDPRSGYQQNHVLGPLNQAMGDFDPTNKRIDLVIGTHYDADHLEGMIPIVSDRSIEISSSVKDADRQPLVTTGAGGGYLPIGALPTGHLPTGGGAGGGGSLRGRSAAAAALSIAKDAASAVRIFSMM